MITSVHTVFWWFGLAKGVRIEECRVLFHLSTFQVHCYCMFGPTPSVLVFSTLIRLAYTFRKIMTYVLLIKEQLEVFLDSLRKLISGKHDIIEEPFPSNVTFEIDDNVQVEVVKLKLDSSPNFKPSEYGFQCKFIQIEKTIEIHGFCWKNYEIPDSSTNTRRGKITVKLATLQKAAEKLSRGLEQRTIRIGLSREYIRKVGAIGDVNYYCSFIKKRERI